MRQFRKVKLSGDAASHAWGARELRSFTLGTSDVSPVRAIVREDSDGQLYLQEPGFSGWSFYKLVPRYHAPREHETDRDARLRRSARRSSRKRRASRRR